MGMTANQLALVRYVAENNLAKAKQAALCCCAEDNTQKNHYNVVRYQNLLKSGGLNMIELPSNISSFATMEDLSVSYLENRYYVTKNFSSLLPYLNTAMEYLKKREEKEEELIKAFTSLKSNWQVDLSEWKLEHNVHEITEYQAKRFARWYTEKVNRK